jgi:8-oxo-dGTP pyrophosphatase MutT (NUDIX family)
MAEEWPKILSRRATGVSPWVTLIEREVEFAPGRAIETYHAVATADYIAIVAMTPDRKIPIVGQFRPAIECFTWELPAGLLDPGENPIAACRRELLEETGFPAHVVTPLGAAAPCTGRLSNRIHSFFVETGSQRADFQPEIGLELNLVSLDELAQLIGTGSFVSQLHLGALLLAELHSFVQLPRRSPLHAPLQS